MDKFCNGQENLMWCEISNVTCQILEMQYMYLLMTGSIIVIPLVVIFQWEACYFELLYIFKCPHE